MDESLGKGRSRACAALNLRALCSAPSEDVPPCLGGTLTPPSLSLLSFNKRGRADRLQVALLLQFTRSPLPPPAWTTFPCFTDRELPLPLLKPCDTGMLLTNDLSQLGWQLFFLALRWCLTFNEIRFVNKDLSFFFLTCLFVRLFMVTSVNEIQ